MEPLKFFDCNCTFGMRASSRPGSFYKVEELIKYMDLYGIEKALVYHSMAYDYYPRTGNDMLMEQIKDNKRLYPVWVVMPHHTGAFDSPEALVNRLKKYDVRAVRMFPGSSENNYSLSEWCSGELISMLEKCKIPLIMDMSSISFDQVYNLCTHYPNLKIILTGLGYRADRNLFPLLKLFPNIRIETSGYRTHKGIEEICTRFGAKRLIFGSGMPQFSGASSVTLINYALISDSEKQMIAAGNLERLLEEVVL